jgi:hypothetical protein
LERKTCNVYSKVIKANKKKAGIHHDHGVTPSQSLVVQSQHGNINLSDSFARARHAIMVSSHPSSIHDSFPSSAQLPTTQTPVPMENIKWATNAKKQGSRTRNVYARRKKRVDSEEGFESGLQEKLGSGTREDEEKKEKMISSRSSEETPLQSIKKTNRFPASNRG